MNRLDRLFRRQLFAEELVVPWPELRLAACHDRGPDFVGVQTENAVARFQVRIGMSALGQRDRDPGDPEIGLEMGVGLVQLGIPQPSEDARRQTLWRQRALRSKAGDGTGRTSLETRELISVPKSEQKEQH
jgi:hypothetical protein